jgi:hypothetical protein
MLILEQKVIVLFSFCLCLDSGENRVQSLTKYHTEDRKRLGSGMVLLRYVEIASLEQWKRRRYSTTTTTTTRHHTLSMILRYLLPGALLRAINGNIKYRLSLYIVVDAEVIWLVVHRS